MSNDKVQSIMDTDGENKPVRCFLMTYGTPGLTVGAMKNHMSYCGQPYWPEWAEQAPPTAHLTKAGAQLWLRHLFSLESAIREAIAAPGVAQGWVMVRSPITEEMHVAAVKVLHRANGLDGLPQRMLDAMLAAQAEPAGGDKEDAERYRLVRRGQHWSVLNGIGDILRGEELDAAVDAIRAARAAQQEDNHG